MTKELGKLIATREGDRNYYYDKGLADGRVEGKAEGLIEGKAEGLIEGKAEGLIEGKAEERVTFVSYYVEQIRSRMASGMTREKAVESLSMPDFVLGQVLAELDSTD